MSKVVFFHATSIDKLAKIVKNGLKQRSCLTVSEDMADYYAETISDEDEEPVTLAIDMDDLNQEYFHPDHPGIEEPITSCLNYSEEQIWRKWEDSEQRWQDSLELVKCICYHAVIPAEVIRVVDEAGEHHLLHDYVSMHFPVS